jgi:hypothetical protein
MSFRFEVPRILPLPLLPTLPLEVLLWLMVTGMLFSSPTHALLHHLQRWFASSPPLFRLWSGPPSFGLDQQPVTGHSDLVHDVAYDYYGQRVATVSRYVPPLLFSADAQQMNQP